MDTYRKPSSISFHYEPLAADEIFMSNSLQRKLLNARSVDESIDDAGNVTYMSRPRPCVRTPSDDVSATVSAVVDSREEDRTDYRAALVSIQKTRDMIAQTLKDSNDVVERNKTLTGQSESLEEKWDKFTTSFDAMIEKMVTNIGASLGELGAHEMHEHVEVQLHDVVRRMRRAKRMVVLTGAGVSVSSGIPTYRGSDGTWTMGSENYTPQEIATKRMYSKRTKECWDYFSDRFVMCRNAKPNASHLAIVELEKLFRERDQCFTLVSQNIDNLHRRAGSSDGVLCEIHGNLTYVRCTNNDCTGPNLIERDTRTHHKRGERTPACPTCSSPLRPHVLFFDESYCERLYKSATVQAAVAKCDLLVVVGTMCTTSLPNRIVAVCGRRGVPVIDINPNPNHHLACAPLLQLIAKSDQALPNIVRALRKGEKDLCGE